MFIASSPNTVIESKIRVYEMLGAEVYLYFDYTGSSMTARVDPRTTARAAKKKAATKAPAAKTAAKTTAAEAVVEEVKEAVVKEVEEKKEKVVDADIKEVAAAAKETVKDTG